MRGKNPLASTLTIAAAVALILVTAQPAAAQVIKVEVGVAGMT